MDDLKRIWRRADEAGFHWVSVWDHFYANPLEDRRNPCFEGVAAMSALAALTENVQVGCLVFCALFRNPGLLAKSAITIDHVSDGRANIGVGAGWFEEEFREFGYDFPPLGRRMDQLEEALQIIRSLWTDEKTEFSGDYYQVPGAVASPKPINAKLWVGGRGPKRTPTLAAKYADGFNLPYPTAAETADRLMRVTAACEKLDRNPAEIDTSVNLHFRMETGASSPDPNQAVVGMVSGTSQQVIDQIGQYVDTGVKGINIAFRPPVDWDAFEAYIEDVMPAFS
jgi:F420-dependent oxidoreductase-like protein